MFWWTFYLQCQGRREVAQERRYKENVWRTGTGAVREPEDVASNIGCFVSESGHARIEGDLRGWEFYSQFFTIFFVDKRTFFGAIIST